MVFIRVHQIYIYLPWQQCQGWRSVSNNRVVKEKEGSDDYFTPKPSIILGKFYFNDLRSPSS
jgi:hypothetical protein